MRIGRNAERTLNAVLDPSALSIPTVSIVYFDAVMLFEEKAICE